MQHTAPAIDGNSGGPLLDRRRVVVGVAFSGTNTRAELRVGLLPSQNANFAIAPATVARFLEDYGVRVALPVARDAADAASVFAEARRSVVRVICHRSPRAIAPPAQANADR